MIKIFGYLTYLDRELKAISPELGVLGLFGNMRREYLAREMSQQTRKYADRVGSEYPVDVLPAPFNEGLHQLAGRKGLQWEDTEFHLRYRATDGDELALVSPLAAGNPEGVKRSIRKGFKASMLPLNAILPEEVHAKFVPPEDYFEPHPTSRPDPYGQYTDKAVIRDADGFYLASRKFPHTVLMNITYDCPVGCVGCYKSAAGTREEKRIIDFGVSLSTVERQADGLADWLNSHPEVYDVIISGGEPLLAGNDAVGYVFERLKDAGNLDIVRICTGAIFQGLPFRIDDELVDLLMEFSGETGRRVTFNAHLSNHYQITPEALMAVEKITESGFKIYSQVPIQEGVNYFRDDPEKTREFLVELGRRQAVAGIEPYKWIMDMHPRTPKRYVPLEMALKTWGEISDSHEYPELQRPRTFSILCEEGNILLSGHTLYSMDKQVDVERGVVVYKIPGFGARRTFTYSEPLLPGYNDNPESPRFKA